jgi:hypothetical protein
MAPFTLAMLKQRREALRAIIAQIDGGDLSPLSSDPFRDDMPTSRDEAIASLRSVEVTLRELELSDNA